MKPARPWWRRTWVLILFGAFLLLGVAATLLCTVGLDAYARRYVERLVSDALLVPVRIDRAQFKIRGRSALIGITIVNPAGYRESEACRFDRLDGYLEAGSIWENTIEMRDLVLVHPVLTVDYLDGRSNFGVLIANLAGDAPDPQAVPPSIPGQTFRISRARIIDGVIRFRCSAVNGGFVDLLLPELEMKDFGDAPGSEPTMKKILTVLLEVMAGSALKVENPSIPVEARRSFSDELRKLSGRKSP